jgi:hypothetical protein
MTEPYGIDVLVSFYMGARVDFHKRKDHDLSIHLEKLREGKETWKARHFRAGTVLISTLLSQFILRGFPISFARITVNGLHHCRRVVPNKTG